MDKKEFLQRLNDSLAKLPDHEKADAVNFYDEIISDKIEAGLSEDEAVASLGDVSRLRAYITAESVENSMRRKSTANTDAQVFNNPVVVPDKQDNKRDDCCNDCARVKANGREKSKNPIKSFFTVLALCTSPILIVLGVTFVIVLLSLLISFASVAVGLFAGSLGALLYGIVIAGFVAQSVGAAAAAMTFFAYLFAAALLCLIGVLFLKFSVEIIKSVVALFAKMVKKRSSRLQPAKEEGI